MKTNIFIRALWWKEYRQTRILLGLMLLILFILFFTDVLSILDQWNGLDKNQSRDMFTGQTLVELYGRLMVFMGGFLLPIWQLGPERRNEGSALLCALPYRREIIYGTKWMIGVAHIGTAITVSVLLNTLLYVLSGDESSLSVPRFVAEGAHSMFFTVAIYTFALFLGAFTGTWVAQAMFFLISFPLYEFLVYQLKFVLQLFRGFTPRYYYYGPGLRDTFWDNFNLVNWVARRSDHYPYTFVGVASLLLLSLGIFLYARNPLENNGKLIVFPSIERILIAGFVLCSTFVGGSVGCSAMLNSERMGYVIGAVLGMTVGYLLIRKLTRRRIRM